ncbi:hypothetical protein PHLGIDRAFT_101680 [Phlebiopsis gigantea 11061_1 CR5-6]|uniref:EthD domain-containing protein n=1 Tax=Phlebiopsis gigantea (strain 11061_1 CR5-6) TaxID=745531 RepID=A0A0C3PRZ9_PHLG1|nr:hypothetical protein PHLGIDRAFT_101680 [Phlebiopsis gigantea 11061_1 CR5-6]
MAPPAYLLVFSDPGTGVSEEEFTDWYDNEHVPLRVDIPAFLSWTRWKEADGQKPTWAASYDLTSYEDTQKPPYTTLAETRSEREKRVIRDMGVLERRTYELMDSPGIPPPSPLFDEKKRSRFLELASIDVKPGSETLLDRWYDEEHSAALASLPGWVRSRRFVLKDWARAGVEGRTNEQAIPRFIAVHEWESVDAVHSEEVKASFQTPLRAELAKVLTARDVRTFEYYRHW